MTRLNYNYIIIGSSGFYETAYSDLFDDSRVKYYHDYVDGVKSPILRLLIKLNFNIKINKYIPTPLRFITFPYIFRSIFPNNNPLCFIFFGNEFAVFNTNYIEYLKKTYPSAKLVLFMHDIIASSSYYNIDNYKKRFDLILSYDRGDCSKYGLTFYETPYSVINLNIQKCQCSIDIFFCGKAKNRYNTIIDVYRKCKAKGLKCLFYIYGVSENHRIDSSDIVYDKYISYLDNLSYVVSCKCILEIMQDNADGFTPRLWEAIAYGKHLLTNNHNIEDSAYYNRDMIHFLDDIELISEWINQEHTWSNDIMRNKSPKRLLEFLDSNFLNNKS